MKTPNRITIPEGETASESGPSAAGASINVMLEPELLEIAADWPAAKRAALARKFGRWANQLAASAALLAVAEQIGQGGHQIRN